MFRLFRSCSLVLLGVALPSAALAQAVSASTPAPSPALKGALTYTSDINADLDGGVSQGAAYLQRVGLLGDADLDRLVGWRGASLHLAVHAISGTGLSGLRVGNILTVSGIEAEPAFRLFNLWVQQDLGKHVTLRIGQFTAGQEFAISNTAGLFINSTFGWPGSFATDLPSGGSAYPLAGPGVRLAITASDKLSARFGLFSGDPAGQGTGDPQRRDLHGFNGFRLQGAPFVMAEVARSAGGDDPAWSITLGGWAHFDKFADLKRDVDGKSLALPSSTGQPLMHDGDYALYGMVDGRVWRSGARSINMFLRVTASPADRNPIDLYVDGGVSVTGLFPSRPADVAGLGVAIARLSPKLRSLVRERASLAGQQLDVPGYEGVVEATYQLQLHPSFSIQPNVQLILNPSAALLGDPAGLSSSRRALVVGLRTSLRL